MNLKRMFSPWLDDWEGGRDRARLQGTHVSLPLFLALLRHHLRGVSTKRIGGEAIFTS